MRRITMQRRIGLAVDHARLPRRSLKAIAFRRTLAVDLAFGHFVTVDQIEPNGPWAAQRYF